MKRLHWNSHHYYALMVTCVHNKVPVNIAWRIRKGGLTSGIYGWELNNQARSHLDLFFWLRTLIWEEDKKRPSKAFTLQMLGWPGGVGCSWAFQPGLLPDRVLPSPEAALGVWLEVVPLELFLRGLVPNMLQKGPLGTKHGSLTDLSAVADRSRNTPKN